jgi:SAM-dependent methyltransferase
MMSDPGSVPSIFQGAVDYQHNLDALEIAQSTFNEQNLYEVAEELALRWSTTADHKPRLLDLCCATGMFSYRISSRVPASSITLVDTDPHALARALLRYVPKSPVVYSHCTDATTFSSADSFDLILMNSAYHHIEDQRKQLFLVNARRHLAPAGRIIIGDHFLPSYHDDASFRLSVQTFYGALLNALRVRGESEMAQNTIRCAGLYTYCREYEYKVSWERFIDDVASAALIVEHRIPVWQQNPSASAFIGTMALTLRPM